MSDASELFLQKLPQIEQIVTSICRRSGMDADATEEFSAEVKLRLVDHDYAVIRKFQDRSSFEGYIAAVVKRMLLDYRNEEWGKWRPSAEALRLGQLAVDLERLLYRDSRSVAEAMAMLTARYENATRDEVDQLIARLPVRIRRKHVELGEAESIPARSSTLDPGRAETARRVSAVVVAFIDRLPAEDQLLLRLRFHSAMTVAQIARALHLDQPLLYRRLRRHFDALRGELASAGIVANDVEELIGTDTTLLDFRLKNCESRPSEDDESGGGEARQEEIS